MEILRSVLLLLMFMPEKEVLGATIAEREPNWIL